MIIDDRITASDLLPLIDRMWDLSAQKILAIEDSATLNGQTPVFTVEGRYQPQGWTEWTQGFQFGSAILQYDATGDDRFLEIGRRNTVEKMAPHVTHQGVHDHGFNNVSTYGNLWRLMNEQRIPENQYERHFYEIALKASGAVQAMRWSPALLPQQDGDGHRASGYIYSFNGPQSLFADTIRSLRSLALSHRLGHVLMGENDEPVSLLQRLLQHAETTSAFNVYRGGADRWRGNGLRDVYDIPGRVAHESIFNRNDGNYRCPSTQQGYSPFTTWTRGLAWIILGYAEQAEFLRTCRDDELAACGSAFADRSTVEAVLLEPLQVTADSYIHRFTPTDGIPYWDTGAPGLSHMENWMTLPSDPFNAHEPVDSSAAAITAQGLLRFARILQPEGVEVSEGLPRELWQAGLTVAKNLLSEPYLSTDPQHEGLLLHSVYHRPKGWDRVPAGSQIPHSESCMWGDYHLRELALFIQRIAKGEPYYTFFGE